MDILVYKSWGQYYSAIEGLPEDPNILALNVITMTVFPGSEYIYDRFPGVGGNPDCRCAILHTFLGISDFILCVLAIN